MFSLPLARNSFTLTRKRWFILSTVGVLALVLTVSFFLRGGMHGQYIDDYSEKAWAFDFASGHWKLTLTPEFNYRPLRSILTPNLANTLPDYEWVSRLLILTLHLANFFMVGLLIRRTGGSLLLALFGSPIFLVPVFANQGLLWFNSALDNLPALFFLLLGLHLILSCRSMQRDWRLLVGGIVAWLLMINFSEIVLFVPLLLPVFVLLQRQQGKTVAPAVWTSALAVSYAFLGAYSLTVLPQAVRVAGRTTLDPGLILSERVPAVFQSLSFIMAAPQTYQLWSEALELGWREWTGNPIGWVILAGLLSGIAILIVTFPFEQEKIPPLWIGLTLFFTGLAWVALSLVPVLLVKRQDVEVRYLYTPAVGFALSGAGLLGFITGLGTRLRKIRMQAALLLVAVLLLVSSVTMAGLVRTFQFRWELDRNQVQGLRKLVPSLLRDGRVWILPVGLNESTVRNYFGRPVSLDTYLAGVFETTWSATAAVTLDYGQENITVGHSNRSTMPTVSRIEYAAEGEVRALSFAGTFNDESLIPVDQLLAFTYKKGRVILLNPLVIYSSGAQAITVDLPLATRLASPGAELQTLELEKR